MGVSEQLDDQVRADQGVSAAKALTQTHERRTRSISLSTVAALVAATVAAVSLWQANGLQRKNNQLQQASLNSRLEEAMVGVDQHFVTHAKLRPFFFTTARGEIMPPVESHLSYEAMATAEMIIDFADDVASYLRTEMMKPNDTERWEKIVRPYFEQSLTMRLSWYYQNEAYDRVTACILGAPPPEATKAWSRETNKRRYPWPSPCTKNS